MLNRSHTHRADPGVVTHRIGDEAESPTAKPLGAANSVFDVARKAARKMRIPVPAIDIDALQVRSGIPLPPSTTGRGTGFSVYAAVLEKMKAGDSVELLPVQARSLVSYAKKQGVKVAVRRLSETATGVWRL